MYKCDAGPGYCSQFDPAGDTGLGWKAVGYCRGTRRPTGSPTLYGGTCTYEKCVDGTVSPTTSPSGSPTKDNLEVCTTEDVLNYSTTTEYESGDVVRIGTKRYKCRGLPNGLWCKNPAYAPAESNVWEQAWVEDGNCSQSTPID